MYSCNTYPNWRNQAHHCAVILSQLKLDNPKFSDIIDFVKGFNWLPCKKEDLNRFVAMILSYNRNDRPLQYWDNIPNDEDDS